MRQAPAKSFRILATALLLASALAGPAAYAQLAQSEPPAAGVAVNRDFILGSWSDAGDCSTTIAFTADGVYTTGDAEGQWSLSGDTLTLTGEAGATTLTIIPIDRNTMEVVGEDGAHDRSTRCAGDLGDVHFDAPRVA